MATWSTILLMSTIFIADMFHAIAEASSIIFNLCLQFFFSKIFALERLPLLIKFS